LFGKAIKLNKNKFKYKKFIFIKSPSKKNAVW